MTATTCPDCTAAATNKHWGGYHAGCQGCAVRALASGFEFYGAKTAGRMVPAYSQALKTIFGDDWQAGHERVKAEHARLALMRAAVT